MKAAPAVCWICIGLAAGLVMCDAHPQRDAFVRTMESVLGVVPGSRKPILQCQCSIEYVGTEMRSRNLYAVLIRKLD